MNPSWCVYVQLTPDSEMVRLTRPFVTYGRASEWASLHLSVYDWDIRPIEL